MSKLVETYALNCGVPIGNPHTTECFFPLDHPIEKTILIHAFSGAIRDNNATFPAKIYDHFSEVIMLLKPLVEKLGYKIFQIGSPGEPGLPGIESLCGRTTYNQCVYLVRKCALLIGNDSMWIHHRGWFGGSLVSVYGPTDSKNHGPYWNDPKKTILIESHRKGKKPTYSSHENPKTIDFILPESITNAALSLLNLPNSTHESLWFGGAYHAHTIELVPNIIMSPQVQTSGPIIIRMDYHFDENNLAKNLMIRQGAIVTDKEIDINILTQLKQNITGLRVEIDKVSPDWIRKAQRVGIQMGVFASERDPEKIIQMRLKYADACLFDLFVPPTKEEFVKSALEYLNKPLDTVIKFDKMNFKTNKFLLADGKVFLSKAHWKAGKNTQSSDYNTDAIIDNQDFWADQAHFYFYQ